MVVAGGGAWRSCPAARRAFTAGGGAQACAGGAFAAISFIVRDGWFRGGHRWAQPFSDCHHCTIACPCMSFLAVLALALIRAAIAGWWRSVARQRLRWAAMFWTGMPSMALILAYGMGGSWVSMVISCWRRGGRCVNAS